MDEIKRLEKMKMQKYGEFKIAETRANDIGLIATIISVFAYCLFLVTIGIKIFPEASTAIGKSIGGSIVIGSIIVVPNIIGNIVFMISYKLLRVDFKYKVYDCCSWLLRNYIWDKR